MNLFITGTDTGVGKTYVTAWLVRHLRAQGLDTVGFKPICCGGREDAEILCDAADGALTLNEVNPVWLRPPAAPYVAAMIENRAVDLALIRETFQSLRARHRSVLVEGVGGWLVPIERDYTVADLAREMALPVAVVVRNQLGVLNHTALTLHHLRGTGLKCAGIIFNDGPVSPDAPSREQEGVAVATNESILENWLGVKVLYRFGTGQSKV